MGSVLVHAVLDLSDRCHVWRDGDGDPYAAIRLGAAEVIVSSAEEARAIAAKFLKAADDMDALPPAPPEPEGEQA